MTHTHLEPGWYTDGDAPAYMRWWNGAAWTEQRKLRPGLSTARVAEIRRARATRSFSVSRTAR